MGKKYFLQKNVIKIFLRKTFYEIFKSDGFNADDLIL